MLVKNSKEGLFDDCDQAVISTLITGRLGLYRASQVKNPPANAGEVGDAGSILGSRRSPGGGNGNPLHCSCLENPMDRGA